MFIYDNAYVLYDKYNLHFDFEDALFCLSLNLPTCIQPL